MNKIFVVDSNTSMTAEELDIKNLLDVDLSVEGIKNGGAEGNNEYKVLIYHTHGSESFADSREGVKEDTIIGVGSYLAEILRKEYGISVYHDETAYDMIDGVLDRSKAYENAYVNVTKILQENPSIEVVIDLHRDGVNEETHLVTEVNGKPTAKIMFLNGVSRSNMNGEIEYLKNPNKLTNLSFSFQMYLAGKEHYGDYIRKIYVRSLRYNLHLMPRAALIEAGAQNNTVQEEKNAMEPLAAILDKVLSKKE
ncbi:MAG: stage II sporulation protein P [Lachnospiraceae bacterium]|nr:stage II sporulation protein P [Lachnospiraceae bacterium]